jgi:ferritin-like metal-binding protein YciE
MDIDDSVSRARDDLLLQVFETERSAIEIYEAAIRCAVNDELRLDWQNYLEDTEQHADIARQLLDVLGVDPAAETAGRKVIRAKGQSLVRSMEMASAMADRSYAELAAAEAVVNVGRKNLANWVLIPMLANHSGHRTGRLLSSAAQQVEVQAGKHFYQSLGWARELWLAFLGLPAVLPPPEKRKDVETAIGASRAEQARGELLDRN